MLNKEQIELINLAIEELVNRDANSPYIQNAIDYINKVIGILKNENTEDPQRIPYLSKYYSPFEYDINDEIQQEFYVTDYFQKEYMLGE